ncbi:MAG: TRL-like family protein [Rickettsiales bacterium]|jgi:hypothetical protein|nr:TRL-like family protein [Rickettsiales bacterium]
MKKSAWAAVLFVAGCVYVPTETGVTVLAHTKQPIMATVSNGEKVGRACARNILGAIVGDSSVETAKKNGGITQVASVDKEVTALLLYAEVCTVVTGK